MCEKQQWITETPNSSEDQRKNYLREISYTLQAEEREQNEKNLKTAINTTLKEIFSNNQISQYLALKWGIAANYYWLNRESTDIDLDVLDISKELKSLRGCIMQSKTDQAKTIRRRPKKTTISVQNIIQRI